MLTAPNEFETGHLKGSINIEASKLNAKELYEKLPKTKLLYLIVQLVEDRLMLGQN